MPKHLQQKKRSSPLRTLGKVLYITVFVLSLLIVVGFAVFKLWARPPEQPRPAPPTAGGAVSRPAPTDDPNTPEDESLNTPEPLVRKPGYYTFLLAASDQGGGNADTIMVVSYDTVDQKVGVISIPRDTIVTAQDQSIPKINAAYHGEHPAENLKAVVSNLLGFPVDHYMTVNINAFKALVDIVDGVDFYVPCDMDYDDPYQDLSIHYTEGFQHLNGQQAMEVVRFRHNNDGSGYTDTGRARTQQQLLKALGRKVLRWYTVTSISSYVNVFATYVRTDLEMGNLAWFATQAFGLDTENGISTATLPGDGSVTYRGVSWCYALEPQATLDIINELVNPYTTDLTLDMTGIVVP